MNDTGATHDAADDALDDRLDAGDFDTWLVATHAAIAGTVDADVPCDGCTACCTSSQFVSIAPDETDALAHIPGALLFPAPGRPPGHVVLGYDERGRCPLLGDRGCTIYAHRPRTCRTYDCRVFTATAVVLTEPTKADIARRAARWRFTFATERGAATADPVQRAAAYLAVRADELDPDVRPRTDTQRAVAAIALHDVFAAHPARDPDPVDVVLRLRSREG